jgi:N6-adenosine-specific RNA methylase IME4
LDSGCEALVNAVDQGDVALADAAGVVDLPPGEQGRLLQQVQDGTFRKLKGARHKAEIDKQREQIESGQITLPEGLYEVIVIDPPWPYDLTYDPDWRRGGIRYPNMSIEELEALELPAAEDCILWLWTTNAFMPEACALLEPWGFELRTILTWVKPRIGLGRWLRNCTEHCLLATKGTPQVDLRSQSTVLEAPAREHSRKPDQFYEMVEGLCVGRRLDYFSREKRPGWAQAGNETGKFGAAQ